MSTAEVQPITSAVTHAIQRTLYDQMIAARELDDYDERCKQIKAGTHRFAIHPGQAIYLRPQGFLLNRAEERKRRLEDNAAAVELWGRRYAVHTPDGLEIRER